MIFRLLVLLFDPIIKIFLCFFNLLLFLFQRTCDCWLGLFKIIRKTSNMVCVGVCGWVFSCVFSCDLLWFWPFCSEISSFICLFAQFKLDDLPAKPCADLSNRSFANIFYAYLELVSMVRSLLIDVCMPNTVTHFVHLISTGVLYI